MLSSAVAVAFNHRSRIIQQHAVVSGTSMYDDKDIMMTINAFVDNNMEYGI